MSPSSIRISYVRSSSRSGAAKGFFLTTMVP